LYLLDFGAVKQATAGGGTTNKSTGIYSAGFAPPEQMAGSQVYPSSDLYALAATCLMLLTGKHPTELFDSYSNVWKWQNAVRVSDRLAQVLNKMLQSSASQRFPSAEAVLHALQPPVSSPPPSTTVPSPPASISPSPPASISPSPPASISPAHSPHSPSPPLSPSRSTLELLANAAFTGFEGGLLAIAIVSLLGTTVVSAGFWLVLLIGLVLFQARRIIERVDLLIIAGITLAVVLIFPIFHQIVVSWAAGNLIPTVVLISVMGGLLAIAITALFRLIYTLLSRVL
jgi:serine/threonine-protein kinase